MTTLRTSAFAAVVATLLGGCDLGALFVDDPALAVGAPAATQGPSLVLPPPRPPRKARSVDEALDLYPSPKDVEAREPFLTEAEQKALVTGGPVREGITAKRPIFTPRRGRTRSLSWHENADVSFIVFGQQDGRRTAIIEGRLLQEGNQVGDYVVVSIEEDGIRLREIDGAGTRFKKFRREAAELWK